MICFRCVRNQKKYRFFLFKKCAKCIRVDKKYEFAIFKVNFFDIDKTITKLEKNKLKIEIIWEIANELTRSKQSKLKRFREQKRFLKEREQTMFNKSLNNVKQLKRLKKNKKNWRNRAKNWRDVFVKQITRFKNSFYKDFRLIDSNFFFWKNFFNFWQFFTCLNNSQKFFDND